MCLNFVVFVVLQAPCTNQEIIVPSTKSHLVFLILISELKNVSDKEKKPCVVFFLLLLRNILFMCFR